MEDNLKINGLQFELDRAANEICIFTGITTRVMTISFNAEELDKIIPWLQAKRAEMK